MKPKSLIWIGIFLFIIHSVCSFEVKVNNPFPGQMLSGIYDINVTCDSDFDNISIYLNDSLKDSFIPPGCNYNQNSVSYPFDTTLVGNGIYTLKVIAFKNDAVVSDSVDHVTVKNTFLTRALDNTAEFLGSQILSKNYFFIGVLLVTILFVIILFSVRIMASSRPGSSIEELSGENREKSFQQERPFEIMPLDEMPRHKDEQMTEEPEPKAEQLDSSNEKPDPSTKDEQDYLSFKKQKELEFFVKHCRRQSYSTEEIQAMLVRQGWDESFITEFLKSN